VIGVLLRHVAATVASLGFLCGVAWLLVVRGNIGGAVVYWLLGLATHALIAPSAFELKQLREALEV
jgi:membrane protein YqaA with SNARE-associated domain